MKYWIWLSALTQTGERSRAALIAHYGDAERAFHAPAGEMKHIKGVTQRDAELFEKRDLSAVPRILKECERQGLEIIPFTDPRYPERLRNIYAPPAVLFVKGRLPEVDKNAVIAVIGTRRASEYGLKMSRKLAYETVKCGGIVASGLTAGIDSAALTAALDAGGGCIAVLGTPHESENSPLAERIAACGALVSEYPPGTRAYKSFFRARNRITAGFSVGVAAIEAPEKSGTSLFITEAAEQGREIFAVPGNADSVNSVGTNGFIRDGAKPVTSGWDVLCEFESRYPVRELRCTVPPESAPPVKKEGKEGPADTVRQKAVDIAAAPDYSGLSERLNALPPDQKSIVEAMRRGCSYTDELTAATGLPAARVLAQLTVLEIKGITRKLPGGRAVLKE